MKPFSVSIYLGLFVICVTSVFFFNPYIKHLKESPPVDQYMIGMMGMWPGGKF